MQLYIGNKNYSSWSLRPWLLMKEAGIAFEEIRLHIDFAEDSLFKQTMLALAPTGKVPLLVDDGFAVWDTLAIAEYLAERCPGPAMWPLDVRQRARARSLCAEMHSGFGELRNVFCMNVKGRHAAAGARVLASNAAAARDLERIDTMWSEALAASGGPFLFGGFGIADAYYAPVCSRMKTYALPLSPVAAAYAERVRALPSFVEWSAAAHAETEFLAEDEPYAAEA